MTETPSSHDRDEVWRAYEAAQRHHDSDLTLFNARTNLFLLVETALIAAATAGLASKSGSPPSVWLRIAVAAFGVLLSSVWFIAAVGAYNWTKAIRAEMVNLAEMWSGTTEIPTSARVFYSEQSPGTREESSRWQQMWGRASFVRPTLVFCVLPLIYALGWIALPLAVNW